MSIAVDVGVERRLVMVGFDDLNVPSHAVASVLPTNTITPYESHLLLRDTITPLFQMSTLLWLIPICIKAFWAPYRTSHSGKPYMFTFQAFTVHTDLANSPKCLIAASSYFA